jgi:hypothetical protein
MEMEMLTEENILNGICNIKCKLCNHSIPMTPPFNICRAIRHVKMKHPEVMPEHKGGESSRVSKILNKFKFLMTKIH